MGIQGLLPLLKSIMVSVHIKDLEGCCVAIDTYSWLHKGALSCSIQLCKGQPTSRHIDYCMHRVNLLQHYGVKPILVFDGGLLPMKGEQENKRARARKENLARAIEHESNGNSAAAYECYQKAVDISPSIAYELIQVLKQENVDYVVAPYEADAQMTFLAVSKQVEAVITEDSDLIPFGCPRIIFKMDKFGQGFEFRNSMLQQNKELSFAGFTKQMVLDMCILSGCDYLQSLPGMGLKRAHALINKFKSYDKVIKHLRYSTVSVPPHYEESFKKAIWTFQHQRVYDPVTEDIVHLSPLSDEIDDDLDFLGPLMPQHIAKGIARGDLDPFNKMPFQGENVSAKLVPDRTYQLKNFKPERKKLDLPAQKNLLTNYFCFASLEAKRKFRAPRATPKHSNSMDKSSPSPAEHFPEEAAACKINCSSGSPLDPGNLGVGPLKGSVDDGVAPKAPEFSESPSHGGLNGLKYMVDDTSIQQHALLQQSSHSIHKPCLALHKERECKYSSEAVEGKAKIEERMVIVRSSYFQHRVVNENDCDNKNEMFSVKDDVSSDENTMVDDTMSQEHALLQQSSHSTHKPCLAFHKKCECKYISDAVEGKTRIEERKVIVRSSYFQHKVLNENDCDNKNEMLSVKDDVSSDENTIPESASFGEKIFKGTVMKRKVASIDNVQTGNENFKNKRTNASPPNRSNCSSNLNDTAMGMKTEEEKFGCNISHLGQYSDIAEKSMERFVSVISSFRCSSSGSRASGLRAPLKDVRNTCTNKSTVSMDLSKFAYAPNKQRTASTSQRGSI